MKPITLRQFFKQFPDDQSCLEHLFNVRFGQGYKCPKCEREAKWYPIKSERAYSCQWCGHHLHPTVGTLFEKSRTSLQLWFYAIYLFTTTRHGVSGKELQRQLGVTYKCAYRMGQQIREHMANVDGKAVIFGMMERNGDVMTHVVPNVRRKTLRPIIDANVKTGSTVNTDELKTYHGLNHAGYTHETVNHGAGEYVNGETHVNSLEGYWSQLKKSIRSTHIHVSEKHLAKYAKEFEYRFNSRKNPEQMFPELISTFQDEK